MAYVYSSVEDAKKDEKGENARALYFSFPNDTTDIPKIDKGEYVPKINIGDLIQMKSGYAGKTVKYFAQNNNNLIAYINYNINYEEYPLSLTDLENNGHQIYIVIE